MFEKEILYWMMAEHVEKNGDFFDAMFPFIEYCLFETVPDKLSAISLHDIVEKAFPFGFPLSVYETMIHKLEQREIIKLVEHDGQVYYEPTKGFHSNDVNKKASDIRQAIIFISIAFMQFLNNIASKRKQYSLEECKNIILKFIIDNTEQLFSCIKNEPVSFDNILTDEERYASLFIIEEYESKSTLIGYLFTIIKGVVCYEFIYYKNSDQQSGHTDFSDLKVFLDAPLVIYALGYSGLVRKQVAQEIITLLKSHNAQIYCYNHSLREIRDILYACEVNIKHNSAGYGPLRYTIEYFQSQRDCLTKLISAISNLENDIPRTGISIYSEKVYEKVEKAFFLEEHDLITEICRKMNIHPDELDRAEADASSINQTYALREGIVSVNLSESRAIFTTKNRKLARISSNFIDEKEYNVPTCIHHSDLSACVLLLGEIPEPELPISVILENCYAAIAPKDYIWDRYIELVNKNHETGQISDYDYLRFRTPRFSRRGLLTFEISGQAISSLTYEEIVKIEEERHREDKKNAILTERAANEAQMVAYVGEADTLRRIIASTNNRMLERINRSGYRVDCLINILKVVFVISTIALPFVSYIYIDNDVIKWIVMILSALVSGFGAYVSFFPNKFGVVQKLKRLMTDRIKRDYPSNTISG